MTLRLSIRLSILSRVLAALAGLLAALALPAAYGLFQLRRLGDGLEVVNAAYHPLSRLGAQLEAAVRGSELALDRQTSEPDAAARPWLLEHAFEYQPRVARSRLQVARELVQRARSLRAAPAEAEFLDRLESMLRGVDAALDEYVRVGATVRRLSAEQAGGGNNPAARATLDTAVRRLRRVEDTLASLLQEMGAALDARINQRVREAGRLEQRTTQWLVVLVVLALAVSLFVVALVRRLLAPIGALTERVKDIGEGRFAVSALPAPAVRDDELTVLAQEFDRMARKLAERDRQLQDTSAQVVRAERLAAVGRLSAQIAHEIRNPLASLSLNAELLGELVGTEGEASELVRAMGREVDRLTGVTEQYLQFARLPRARPEWIDVQELVEEVADFVRPECTLHGVVLEVQDQGHMALRADPGQLRQVLLNLIRNAREASPPGGRIRIGMGRSPPGLVRLWVTDHGPGLTPEARARLFEPFFSTKQGGTGLGLALVQQVMGEHGGRVTCTSRSGETTLMLEFPAVADHEVGSPTGAREERHA